MYSVTDDTRQIARQTMPFLNNNHLSIQLRRGELDRWLSDSCKQALRHRLLCVNPYEEVNKTTFASKDKAGCSEQFKRMMDALAKH